MSSSTLHGSWCWDKVVPLLAQADHQVEAIDLPGPGQAKTPICEITLAAYTKRVYEALEAHTEPVILVGHSLGGMTITQVTQELPEKIQRLVYLTAVLLQNGVTARQLAQMESDSLLVPNLVVNREQGCQTFKDGAPLKDIFYGDCSQKDAARAISLLIPEPLAAGGTPSSITTERFGRVSRVYIECLRDRAIPPALQKRMYMATPCQTILSMETSHSPFFSAPQELVRHLSSLATVSYRTHVTRAYARRSVA